MKYLAALVAASLLFISTSHAVTWHVVTVSVVVNLGGSSVTKTTLNAHAYLQATSTRFGVPMDDLFIGFRDDTGEIAVVQISTKTVKYFVVTNLNGGGTAKNGTSTSGTSSQNATVSSLNTDFAGYFYDKFTRNDDGSLKRVSRQFMGGDSATSQTIIGTAHTTAKKFEL